MTNPPVLPNFPYRLKFTQVEKNELLERIEKFRFILRDGVGLSGHTMSLDEGTIANLAAHLALAGSDVVEEKAYIWGRVRDDENRMFADQVEWLVKKDVPQPAPEPSENAALEASQIASQMKQLHPAVRVELARIMQDQLTRKDGDQ